ncbi:hypothetical protein M9458_030981, partial [Cirrhinus mrigala]
MCLYEGTAKQGNPTLLNEIYTELYITESESGETSNEHEDTPIKCSDIFRPLPGQDKLIRTVLTKGIAGIGKTVSVQKFILDWAEGKENQDCRLSLYFQSSVRLCDVSESASVDVLLTNIIVGNLLPSALIWITSRQAASDLVPSECVHRLTEVEGFNDPQKEEYFRKRISDQSLANRIISHLKSSRSLYIMCHIPVFCWISAAVLDEMFSQAESGEIPKTLTQMYTHFLILQINIKYEKDYEKNVTDEDMIFKLGKLAFQQLVKGNLIFYEEDLRECRIGVTEASVYSGLCTQIFREEFGLYQGKHSGTSSSSHICISVDEALQSKNGHLDLFLQFLLGLSVESQQILLQGLMKQTKNSSDNNKKTVEYIKKKIRTIESPEKSINLFHCLNELGDHSLVEEIQQYLNSGVKKEAKLSLSQWSAVAFLLLTSEKKLD